MLLHFEKALPIHFVDIHTSITAGANKDFQIIWSTEAKLREPTKVTLVAPNLIMQNSDFTNRHSCIRFQSYFLETIPGLAYVKKPLQICLTTLAQEYFIQITNLANQPASEQRKTRLSCLLTSLISELLTGISAELSMVEPYEKNYASENLKSARAVIYATRYIKKHMGNPNLSLQDIARAIGYNSNYFCQEFSRIFSISPIRFLNQLRVNRTLHLLEHSDLTISAICSIVGFSNPSRLSSMVKSISGMTPVMYRRSKRMQTI